MPQIDPDRMYRLSEAASLIPSTHTSCGIHKKTLRLWIKVGKVHASKRKSGTRDYFFVKGEEIIRVLAEMNSGPTEIPVRPDQTPEHKIADAILNARWAKRKQGRRKAATGQSEGRRTK